MPAAAAIAAALVLAAPSGAADPVRDENGLYDSIPAVILVSGDNAHLVDALTAAPLAGYLGVPIIYTGPGDNITGETLADVRELHPHEIIAIGGTDVVSDYIVRVASVMTVEGRSFRLSGPDRYRTADAVSDYLVDLSYNGARGE